MPAPFPTPAWSLESLRLPKAIENDARAAALHSALRESSRGLWAGNIVVPTAAWTAGLATELENAQREHRLVRGLELIEKTLEREARGQSMADARSATERGSRVSRLLLVSADGTERFYRQVERLVRAQSPRVLVVRLEADSSALANLVPDASGVVRAVMVEHKDSVASVLMALYPQISNP